MPYGIFLVIRLENSPSAMAAVRRFCGAILITVSGLDKAGKGLSLSCSVSFGADLWRKISSAAPKRFRPLGGTSGKALSAPDTGRDVYVQINSSEMATAFIRVNPWLQLLRGVVVKNATLPSASGG